jgi:hypothetical protein
MARTFTFSRSVEPRAARTFTNRTEAPTARIEIGIADSIPCPSFSAMYVAAAEKTTDQSALGIEQGGLRERPGRYDVW